MLRRRSTLQRLLVLAMVGAGLVVCVPLSAARQDAMPPAASGAKHAKKKACRGLHGKKLKRCKQVAKCNKLKGKKRKKCLKARKKKKHLPSVVPPSPPQSGLKILKTRPAPPSCAPALGFDPSNFPSTPKVDNPLLPLVPGRRTILEGRANRGGGPLPHQVVFTVTDLTKVIDGVRTVVVFDVDTNQDEVVEAELAFFAQDRDGNVWNLGEYPEEYEAGNFTGAPKTWIAGQAAAEAGIHMFAAPAVADPGAPWYIQASAPAIDFLDCATVVDTKTSTCVPYKCYDEVLLSYETSPLDPESGFQTKYYAPRVGIVQVGALDDPEGETLVLADRYTLSSASLERARQTSLKLDERAYDVSEVYRHTERARR